MFDKKIVIYLTWKKIWARNFATPKPQIIESEWDGVDPTGVFKEIKDTLKPQTVKIVLGDDLSFVTLVEITGDTVSREMVMESAKSLLPIELSDSNFDWKLVGTNGKNHQHHIQIVAVSPVALNAVSYAVKVHKLRVESVDTISLLLAAATKDRSEPQLISWSGQEQLAVVTHRGTVYVSESIAKNPTEKLKSLAKFTKDKYKLVVTPTTEQTFDPLIAALNQKIIRGQDKDTLEIMLLPNPSEPKTFNQSASHKKETNTRTPPGSPVTKFAVPRAVVVTSMLFVIIFMFVAVGIYQRRIKVAEVENLNQRTTPMVFPSASTIHAETMEEVVDVSTYSVQVLNGSGVAGEATQVGDILKAEGFTKLETGNADSYGHTETLVQIRESVPDKIFNIVERSLNSEYTVVRSETLTINAKYDLIIVVGVRRS